MFSRKTIKTPSARTYKIDYSSFAGGMNTEIDENLLPHKFAKRTYNFKIGNGALQTGLGFCELTLPKNALQNAEERTILLPQNVSFKGVWHFKHYSQTYSQKQHFLVFYGTNKRLYFCKLESIDPNSFCVDENTDYNHMPNAISYRLNGSDVMIFTSPEDSMLVFPPEDNVEYVATAPKVVSMCLHFERLFAIVEGERNELRFSDDLNVTNWTSSMSEGGYIQMFDDRGPMSKVVSFQDYVFVIRDFGIARVSAFGAQSDFSVSQVFSSSGKIYGNSAQVCGENILFLSKNGIHRFDGVSAQKLELGIDKFFDGIINENCASAYFDGKYYLACRLEFGDGKNVGCENWSSGFTNNALLELDLESGELSITRGVDIVSLTAVEENFVSKLVACFGGEHSEKLGMLTKDGMLFGEPLEKEWVSPFSSLGYPGKKKVLQSMTLVSKNPLSIKLKSETKTVEYSIRGSEKAQRITPKFPCESLEVSFLSSCADAHVSSPQIVVSIVG